VALVPKVYPERIVKHLAQVLFVVLLRFGGLGLLGLGILDSSFLFAPLGNDVLVVAMVARSPKPLDMLYYAAMSTVGSVLGCLVVDVVFRQAGERGLDKHLPRKRLHYVKKKVNQNAAWALVIAALAPPPFPFTPFIMAAAALEYPRRRLLTVVGAARMVRFTALGVLALVFGASILRWANNAIIQGFLFALIVVCTVGSIISAYGWIRRSRRATEVGISG
jgi:membrane protein YqaA with SNARE-associated domain